MPAQSRLHLDTNTKLAGKVKTDSEVHNNLKTQKYSDGINTQRSVKAGHCCFQCGDKTEERGIYSELTKGPSILAKYFRVQCL